MIKRNSFKPSVYTLLGIIIVSTVVFTMSAYSFYVYTTTKAGAIQQMKERSDLSIDSLQQNIARLIEAYAIQEYTALILTEIEYHDYLAILVKDYNMGKIFGDEFYINGKIKNADESIVDYDPKNEAHNKNLEDSFYFDEHIIVGSSGQQIGTISIYISGDTLNKELEKIISRTLIIIFTISFFLVVALFYGIHRFILKPLKNISNVISDYDLSGIPAGVIPTDGPQEIFALSTITNRMIETIRYARQASLEQQAVLEREKNRFQMVIEGTNVGTWEWNVQTGECIFSEHWANMFGYTIEEISPTSVETWKKIVHPDDYKFSLDLKEKHFKGELKFYEFESRMHHKNGEWIWILSRGKVATWTDDGKPLMMSGTHMDITDKKNAEVDLRRAKNNAETANKAKSRFLGLMSHELRTPMNGVLGMAQLLKMTELDEEQQSSCDIILSSGNALVKILTDILDLSKIEAGRQQVSEEGFSIEKVMKETTELFLGTAKSKNLKLHYEVQPEFPKSMFGDPELLRRILINLVGNAVKYTNVGWITLKASIPVSEGEKQIVRFQITDTGIGMHSDVMEKIFEPFSQVDDTDHRQYGGTGLGLSIVKELAHTLKGTVTVKSKYGEGSCFTVDLPFGDVKASRSTKNQMQEDETGAMENDEILVLLVEDDTINQTVINRMLLLLNMKIDLASNGKEAVSMSKEKKYHLIFMDLLMPVMSGHDAAITIRNSESNVNQKTPIIALTAMASSEDQEKCFADGMNEYLTKPIDYALLKETTNKYRS